MQGPATVALSDASIAVQPVVVVVNETLSVADPPAEVNVIGVPTVPVRVVFDTVSVASAAKVNVTAGLVCVP